MIFSLLTAAILSVVGLIVHELGHLVFGCLTGYRFNCFRLGPLAWFKEDDRIHFRIARNFAAGQCIMAPVEDFKEFKFVLYNSGGGIFNLILGFACLALVFVYSGDSIIGRLLVQSAAINIFFAITNLIPIKAWTNDGANIFETLKSKDAVRGLYMILYANDMLSKGLRYRDFDKNLFKLDGTGKVNNYMEAYLILYEAAWLEDSGEYDAFVECLKRVNMKKMPGIIKGSIETDLLYYYTFYKPDHSKAKIVYNDKKLKKFLKMPLPGVARIAAAYEFFVEENEEKGKKLLEQAKKVAESWPNKGQRIMETEYIQNLEDAIYGQ